MKTHCYPYFKHKETEAKAGKCPTTTMSSGLNWFLISSQFHLVFQFYSILFKSSLALWLPTILKYSQCWNAHYSRKFLTPLLFLLPSLSLLSLPGSLSLYFLLTGFRVLGSILAPQRVDVGSCQTGELVSDKY